MRNEEQKQKHRIHSWRRICSPDADSYIWMCVHPSCTATATRIEIFNKESICTKCGGLMIMDRRRRKQIYTKCDKCIGNKKGKLPSIDEMIEKWVKI